MLGLTSLGVFHTAISLVAVAAGAIMLVRDRQIVADTPLGKLYIVTTIVTCATGFGIFEHGGFSKAHALDAVTLIALAVAAWGPRWPLLRRWPDETRTGAYSATFLFHMIPGVTETTTRLPFGTPLFPDADAPGLQAITGALALVFLVAVTIQIAWLRRRIERAQT
jgi:uncharacterized membrane protein